MQCGQKWNVGEICRFVTNKGAVNAQIIEVVRPDTMPEKFNVCGLLSGQTRRFVSYVVEGEDGRTYWLWASDLYCTVDQFTKRTEAIESRA